MPDRLSLQERFEYIRDAFFPRWDKDRRWGVQYVGDFPSFGTCDRDSRTIRIRINPENPDGDEDQIDKLLIHEICHTATRCSHGPQWQNTMLKKAVMADMKSRPALAALIRDDVERYRQSLSLGLNELLDIYNQIEDIVWENPEITYEEVIAQVCKTNGLYPDEFEDYLKRSRKVYERVKREALLSGSSRPRKQLP